MNILYMDKLNKKINEIKDVLDPSKDHMFISNELILSEKTTKALKEQLKKNFEPPTKNIKGYIIRIDLDKKNKIPLNINCGQVTITPKLFIGPKDDDTFQTFTYTIDELIKYGFKLSQIKKMIKAIKNNTISFQKASISITELLSK